MGLGLGHRYWVRVVKHMIGNLEQCTNFMNENKPQSDKQWYELHPEVNVKLGTCDKYMCNLVEIAK